LVGWRRSRQFNDSLLGNTDFLQNDLPRGYQDGGAGKNPQAFFTTSDEIRELKRLKYEGGKHFLGVVDAKVRERVLPDGRIDKILPGRESRRDFH
jgi:hypothetical protein